MVRSESGTVRAHGGARGSGFLPTLGRARILLIDDDGSLREVLAFALREQGLQVEVAPNGERGLGLLPSFQPEVVITDLKMPGIGGMEVLRRVQDLDPTVPVVLLTAFGSTEETAEAMRLGAYHHLSKPYDRDELKLTLVQALERRRFLLENRNLKDRHCVARQGSTRKGRNRT